jgi:hypothetical protein
MDRPVPDYPDDVTVYLDVNDFGKFGKAYVETDIAEADREAIIRNFISGQYSVVRHQRAGQPPALADFIEHVEQISRASRQPVEA